MKLLPYETLSIETQLSPEEIRKRLEVIIDNSTLTWNSHKKFRGKIDENTFKIRRIIGGRNSFLPVIIGEAKSGFVEIKMRLSYPVAAFWLIWILSIGTVSLYLLLVMLISKGANTMVFGTTGIFLFGYGLCMVPFNFEVKKAKSLLKDVISGEHRLTTG